MSITSLRDVLWHHRVTSESCCEVRNRAFRLEYNAQEDAAVLWLPKLFLPNAYSDDTSQKNTNMGLNLLPSGKEEGEFMGWRYQCLVSICLDLLHDTYLIFLTLFINWKTEPCTGSSRAKAGYRKSSLYSLPSAAVRERARLPSHFVINILQPQTALIALDLYNNDLFRS